MENNENKTCCDELRSIRQELRLSMRKMATLLGYGGSSSYQYYEDNGIYKKPYFERSFINKLLNKLVPLGIEAKRIERMGGVNLPEDVTNGLSDAEVALTDLVKDIMHIILHHKLCSDEAIRGVLDYQISHYHNLELTNAEAVLREVHSYIGSPERGVLRNIFRLPAPKE